MDPDELTVCQHMLAEFRRALYDAQGALAEANARNAVKDQIIGELRTELEAGGTDGDS